MNLQVQSNRPQFVKAIQALLKKEVLVGIPDTEASRSDSEIGNATLGRVHELGSPAQNIPARPFLRPGIASARATIDKHMAIAGRLALRGKTAEVDQELNKIGIIAQSAVQEKITSGPFEPLKPATLAARRRHGRSGTKPLIDTGQLRRAVTYIVRTR